VHQLQIFLLLFVAIAVAQEEDVTLSPTNSNIVEDDDDSNATIVSMFPSSLPSLSEEDDFNLTTAFPSLSPSFSSSPSSYDYLNQTDGNATDVDDDIEIASNATNTTQPPDSDMESSPSRVHCETMGIFGPADCEFACMGFPYNIKIETDLLENAPGAIQETYRGFVCQCLSALPPVDCVGVYNFQTCRSSGIYNCEQLTSVNLESLAGSANLYNTTSKVTDTESIHNQTTNTTWNNNMVTINNSSDTVAATNMSCAALCRFLGFQERTNDINQNDQDSLCNHNAVEDQQWTSCACGVEVALDGGRTMRIVDGIYVCGDPGFERGLVFEVSGGSKGRTEFVCWGLALFWVYMLFS
jgi:hypothetical protein